MFRQQREKLTATFTKEKTWQNKAFVQIEGKLTETQLEKIAAGGIRLN